MTDTPSVGHNHSSGDPTPSAADRAITLSCRTAADVTDLRFLGHLVLGDHDTWERACGGVGLAEAEAVSARWRFQDARRVEDGRTSLLRGQPQVTQRSTTDCSCDLDAALAQPEGVRRAGRRNANAPAMQHPEAGNSRFLAKLVMQLGINS
jgi:hypothetical protein